jgi:hypothetical protein
MFFLPLAIPLSASLTGRSLDFFPPQYVLPGIIAFSFGLLTAILALINRPKLALLTIVVLTASTVEIADFKVLPKLESQISARPLARELLKINPLGDEIATHNIPRAWRYGLDFYLNRDLPEWTPASKGPRWVAGNIAAEPEFTDHYRIQLDEIAEANKFRVCLYWKK